MVQGKTFGAALLLAAVALLTVAVLPGRTPEPARAAAVGPAGELQIDDLSLTATITRSTFKVTGTDSTGGTGGGAGRATFEPLVVQKEVDATSPALMRTVATGAHLREAVVRVYRPGTERTLTTYTLQDVVVTLLEQTGATERIGLAYKTIQMSSGGESACFDRAGNVAC